MKCYVVKFNEFFDRSIATRIAVENLFLFDKTDINEIVLDFKDIYLISASASHQVIMEIRNLEKTNIQVSMINLNENVEKMLELAKTDRKNIMTVQDIGFLKIKNHSDLNSFLLSV